MIILEFVNFPCSVREKGHLSNFKHLFEQCQPEGEAKWLSPHSAKIIYMLIRADILNKAQLLDNHVILLSHRGAAISCSQSWSNRKKVSISEIHNDWKIRKRATHL